MQAYFVGHMRDIGLARPDAADQRQRLREVEMRRMRGETQRIDRQHLRTAQFFGLGVFDGLEVRQVGQRPMRKPVTSKRSEWWPDTGTISTSPTRNGFAVSISCSSISGTPRYLSCAKA